MTSSLPRRAFMGIELPASDREAFTERGMSVLAVIPASMAHAANLARGDVVVSLAGAPLRSADELRTALRKTAELAATSLVVERRGTRFEARVCVQRWPAERLRHSEVLYHQICSRGERLRTIVTVPSARAGAKVRHAAVLYLPGLSCASIDFGGSAETATSRLVHGWAEQGFVTMRVDRPGVGDSDGGPCERTDLETEVEAYRDGLRALAAYDFVDPDSVFVFGHSVGGMIAPFLARTQLVRGLVVYGTSAAPWFQCVEATTRRQLCLRGATPHEVEAAVARWHDELGAPASAAHAGGLVDGRAAAYHRQLHSCEVAMEWQRLQRPVLVLAGEHDWVVGEDEQRHIAARVNARSPGMATFSLLSGLDHLGTRHASLDDSLRAYGRGAADGRIVTASSAWMNAVRELGLGLGLGIA